MVHLRTVVSPIVSPTTAEAESFTNVADPVPDRVVHVPVSEAAGELAASVPEVELQIFSVSPAAAIVVVGSTVIITSEVVAAHPPDPEVIVHLRIVESPTVSPTTSDVSLLMEDAEPVPEIVVHVPVSNATAALAANIPAVVSHRFCVGPARATVVPGSTLMVISEIVGAHPPNSDEMVHLSIVESPMVSPVTEETSEFTDKAEPVPEIVNHVPVSLIFGMLAARLVVVTLQRFCVGPAAAIVVIELWASVHGYTSGL